MKTAVGFKLIGHCYKFNSRFVPGATIIVLDNGMEEYFSESVSINEAIDICQARGISTNSLRTKIDHWVKTGKWED